MQTIKALKVDKYNNHERYTQHGGDIYRNKIKYDFSVNVNPLGIPHCVKQAMADAVKVCDRYPDMLCEQLCDAIGQNLQMPAHHILCGNGASELLMAVVHALKPERIMIPVPSFYGYEHAANAGSAQCMYYFLKEENGYCMDEGILEQLTSDIDLLILASPNNPVGNMVPDVLLQKVLTHCSEKHIIVLLDQCFTDFVTEHPSCVLQLQNRKELLMKYPNLLILHAFTKTYAIPGVRLGYLAGADMDFLDRIAGQLPEWNVSAFAQAAGMAACRERDYVRKSAEYVRIERELLSERLRQTGILVEDGKANYLLLKTEMNLYEELLQRGILIRDCSNYRGLSKGYYRVAVRTREENEVLIRAVKEIINGREKDKL